MILAVVSDRTITSFKRKKKSKKKKKKDWGKKLVFNNMHYYDEVSISFTYFDRIFVFICKNNLYKLMHFVFGKGQNLRMTPHVEPLPILQSKW